MRNASRFPLSLLTAPGAVLYGRVLKRRRSARLRARGRGWHGVTVVSVGNIEVGGSGKTPFAMHLIEQLSARGQRPVYVSRGYGSEAERIEAVTVRMPTGVDTDPSLTPGVRFVRDTSPRLSAAIGDEGAMVAFRCPLVPLVFSPNRARAVEVAIEHLQPTHIILDDSFQTWDVHRDIDIVLLDARQPFGNGRLVPAGSLRETPDALSRADLVGINGYSGDGELDRFVEFVAGQAGRAVPVFGISRRVSTYDAGDGRCRATIDGTVVAVSSIARPRGFEEALLERGIDIRLAIRYPDHHRYRPGDLAHINTLVKENGADWVVTTEKDWAKLRENGHPFEHTLIARLEVNTEGMDIAAFMQKPQARPAAF